MSRNHTYWLVSVPNDPAGRGNAFETLNRKVSALATCHTFHVPELRVGTLDALMALSDDLLKYDLYVENVTRKIANQLFNLYEPDMHSQLLLVSSASPDVYLTHFKWDEAKYPVKASLRELTDTINSQVSRFDEELRNKAGDYNTLAHSLAATDRNTSGALLNRDLSDIVQPNHYLETEYLTTLFVVVPKYAYKEWETSYETLSKFVVPRSSILISEDSESGLWTVILFKRNADDFRNNAREKRFAVRDFKYNQEAIAHGKEEMKKMITQKEQQKNKLIQWCKTNFAEAFIAWMHLKAIRIFVESVLRYGLPANFAASLVLGHKKEDKRLRNALAELYKHLASKHLTSASDEEGSEVFYPYVFLNINIDFKST